MGETMKAKLFLYIMLLCLTLALWGLTLNLPTWITTQQKSLIYILDFLPLVLGFFILYKD